MQKEKYLLDFIKMSKYVGMHNDYAQAGGGNTSVKLDEKQMAIKASGYQLTDIGKEEGYSIVDYTYIADYFSLHNQIPHDEAGSNEILMKSLMQGKRPSIESFLHAITKRFTVHSHPTCVNVLVSRKGGMQELAELFPDALLVDFAIPGIELADKYFDEIKKQQGTKQDINIIFLKNHGVVVTAESACKTMALHDYVVGRISEYLEMQDAHLRDANMMYRALYDLNGDIVYLFRMTDELKALTAKYGGTGWDFAFAPDCLVYCGKKILDLNGTRSDVEIRQRYADYTARYGVPKIAYKEGNYFIFANNLKKAHEIESVLQFCAKVCFYNEAHEVEWLEENVQNQILNLDSEKYRQKIK